jgi:hypothetical protein
VLNKVIREYEIIINSEAIKKQKSEDYADANGTERCAIVFIDNFFF